MHNMETWSAKKISVISCGLLILFGLYLTSLYSYLLFHFMAEIFSIVIGCGIFMLAWNSRPFLDNNYLLFIGVAFLFIAGIDMLHTLAYKGMGIFEGYNANLPTQLWMAARYMESLSLLVAPLLFRKRLIISLIFATYLTVTFILLTTIFYWHIFPDCFFEETGLTPFKKISEYIICFILIGAIALLYQKREEFEPSVFRLLTASIFITIAQELAFTFYVSVYGLSNLVGHFLKIVSFYLIYKAIIVTGLVKPYDLLFRNLKKSEETLREERDTLQKALNEIKVLRGILPICASCKKIRDDTGYWNQIESYIRDHSEADFSHGVCPECAKKLYPGVKLNDDKNRYPEST
ncbi:MAG: hypothetical protein JRL30_19710 [Deltaproteobacteria bacterium]|nr:hypothetical protein [Deltaproteobacteria bacterium]